MTTPAMLGVPVLLAVLAASPRPAVDVVDFTAPPVEALKLKVVEKVRGMLAADMEGDGVIRRIKMPITSDESFTHTVKKVKAGKVVAIERTYEDAKAGGQDTPLSWKTVRAQRGEEATDVKLEVKDDETWEKAPPPVRAFLTARAAFEPILPLPNVKLRVGESWDVESKHLKAYFAPARFGSAQAEVSGDGRYTLREIKEIDKRQVAMIDVKIAMEIVAGERETITIELQGVAHYDLGARSMAGFKSKGEIKSERSGMTLEGELEVEYKTKVVLPDPAK